jgi:hypothetical protein
LGCAGPFVCFPDDELGFIPTEICEDLFRLPQAFVARELNAALTFGRGGGVAGVAAGSKEVGVVYGPNGEYGCYVTDCVGVETNAGIQVYSALGVYNTYSDVAGRSLATIESIDVPVGAGYATSQIFSSTSNGVELIGSASSISTGVSLSPISAGGYRCDTRVETVFEDVTARPPVTIYSPCVGDCDRANVVTVDMLVRAIDISLGRQTIHSCESLDMNRSGQVEVNELVMAVRNSLDGCEAF